MTDERFERWLAAQAEADRIVRAAAARYRWALGKYGMPQQQLANYVQTTLSVGCTNVAGSITVVSAAGLPTAGNFMLRIDDAAPATTYEIVEVTAVAGAVLTVTRGQEGTTGIAHNAGAFVGNDITAGMFERRVTPQLLQATPSNPASTTSLVGVMAGIAVAFTPTQTGRVLVIAEGSMSNNTVGDAIDVQIRYGTGTAPVNGAALTGTAAGAFQRCTATGAALQVPFAVVAIVTGLTVGTAYWFDLMEKAITGGTAQISALVVAIAEL
jgi:hypothetical protein